MKNILITGHPRSGTMYIHRLLLKLGEYATFEKKCNDYTVSWKHILKGTFINHRGLGINIDNNFKKIIHQVRHPLKVIASATTLYDNSLVYLGNSCELPEKLNHQRQAIRNCMYTYYYWNTLIESKADWRYKIEELSIIWNEWLKQLELPVDLKLPDNKVINSRNHVTLSWDDLYNIDSKMADMVYNMGRRYDYL